jgi:hypothetical protein
VIPPDTKDWTWVLERPCPECGFDASAFAREQVASMIRDTAAAWLTVLQRPTVARRPSDTVVGEQWARPGTRGDGAHFTIESFGRYLIHDPIHHLHDVEAG